MKQENPRRCRCGWHVGIFDGGDRFWCRDCALEEIRRLRKIVNVALELQREISDGLRIILRQQLHDLLDAYEVRERAIAWDVIFPGYKNK